MSTTHRTIASRVRGFALLAAGTLVLAACTSSAAPEQPESVPGGSEAPTATELTDLTFAGFSTGIPSLPVLVAADDGHFEDVGLNVTVELLESPGSIIPALLSGEVDFGYGSFASFFDAQASGIDLVILTGSNVLIEGSQQLWVRDDSGLTDIADLEGQKVGVSAVGSFPDVLIAQALAPANLTLDDITLHEVSFPNMAAAIEAGDVDAGFLPSPFNAAAAQDPNGTFRLLVDFADIDAVSQLPIGGIIATRAWAEANPDLVDAIRAGMADAYETLKDEDYNRDRQAHYGHMAPEVAANAPIFVYPGALSVDDVRRYHELLVEQGQADADLDVASFVLN